MVKSPSLEKIEDEEYSLEQARKEVKNLKGKWIKLASNLRQTEFLEFYIKEKEKFIQRLRGFRKK